MTIEKINDLLQALQSKPGEESVMEIAYALMDWMKIERPNDPNPFSQAQKDCGDTCKPERFLTT
jgi:hypothetical protein